VLTSPTHRHATLAALSLLTPLDDGHGELDVSPIGDEERAEKLKAMGRASVPETKGSGGVSY
jgi:hypothetical protein